MQMEAGGAADTLVPKHRILRAEPHHQDAPFLAIRGMTPGTQCRVKRHDVDDAGDPFGLDEAVARKGPGVGQIEIVGRADTDVEVQHVVDQGGTRLDRFEEPQLHEHQHNGKRDARHGHGRSNSIVNEIKPGQGRFHKAAAGPAEDSENLTSTCRPTRAVGSWASSPKMRLSISCASTATTT